MRMRLLPAFFLLFIAASFASADDWASAQPMVVAAEGGAVLVRIEPGDSFGDTVGFAGAPKGAWAKASWHRYEDGAYRRVHEARLRNPVAPVAAFVTRDGALATLDNWHNLGHGAVVALYRPDGTLLREFTLADLYGKQPSGTFPTSVSSIHWRTSAALLGNTLRIGDALGGTLEIDVATGNWRRTTGQ